MHVGPSPMRLASHAMGSRWLDHARLAGWTALPVFDALARALSTVELVGAGLARLDAGARARCPGRARVAAHAEARGRAAVAYVVPWLEWLPLDASPFAAGDRVHVSISRPHGYELARRFAAQGVKVHALASLFPIAAVHELDGPRARAACRQGGIEGSADGIAGASTLRGDASKHDV